MSKVTYELRNLEFWDGTLCTERDNQCIALSRTEAINLASHLLQWATAQPQDALGSDYDESDESIRADG